MRQMMHGKQLIISQHSSQHYRVLFNQRTGMFIRKEDKGYEEPFWSMDGPELLDIAITNYCERGCTFCYRQSSISGRHMNIDDIREIIVQAQEIGVFQIALGGGNPNQHPEFCEILKLIRNHNIVPSYTTNGEGLTDEILRSTAENCGAMAISVYPPYDSHYERLLKSISEYGIRVNLHVILKCDTIDTIISWLNSPPLFMKYVNAIIFLNYKPINKEYIIEPIEKKKLQLFFQSVSNCKDVKIGFDSCSVSGIVSMMEIPNFLVESCEAARFSAFISEDMKMYPCSFMAGTDCFGNLRTESILDIWQSNSAFLQFRNKIRNHGCMNCIHKSICNGGCQFMPEINLCGNFR